MPPHTISLLSLSTDYLWTQFHPPFPTHLPSSNSSSIIWWTQCLVVCKKYKSLSYTCTSTLHTTRFSIITMYCCLLSFVSSYIVVRKSRHTYTGFGGRYVHGSLWSVGSEVVKEHTHAYAYSQLTCIVVFSVMTQCSLVCGYKHFTAACHLQLYLHLHSADEGSTTPWHAADHLPEPRTPQSDTLTTTLLTYASLNLRSHFTRQL